MAKRVKDPKPATSACMLADVERNGAELLAAIRRNREMPPAWAQQPEPKGPRLRLCLLQD